MGPDPAAGVGVFAALAAGLVSFVSPCVLPLVPGYISAVSGVRPGDLGDAGWRRVLIPSLLFVASFSLVFILLGLSATGIGDLLRDNRQTLNKVAGVVIVLMGVLFIASVVVPRLNRAWRVDALVERAGNGGPVLAGLAFAIAWTPCVGPTLAAILTAASLSDSVAHGGFLLAWYSAGLAIPFLVTALAFSRVTTAFGFVKRHYGVIMATGGAILILMGMLVYTNELFQLNIEAQKFLDQFGLNFFQEV
jgi:cytochrome c-type biogenesis protein